MKVSSFIRIAATLTVAAAASFAAQAQLAPQKPVTLVVPYPAGGPLDNAARILAEKLKPLLKAEVIVDNRPGSGGNVGAALVARAVPDGQTLVMGAVATHAINPWLYPAMPYDALKDFTPITLVARVPNVLVMNADTAKRLNIKDTRDLIAYARKNPGRLNYGSGGNGSAGHLAGELLQSLTKTDIVHLPSSGAAPAQAALLAGQTDLMFDNLASASANIKSGKLVAFGVTTLNRSSSFTDVPPLNDVVPGFHISTWFGIFGPAKLPKATTDQLQKAFAAALNLPDTAEKFAHMSATPSPMSSADFAYMVAKEHADYGRLIKVAKIKLD
ncbi:MAG: tripartite tricarboxylate transporter substrate binding protein [Pseudomonadota bacterium]